MFTASMHVGVALTAVSDCVRLSCLLVAVEVGVEGLQWPSLPALGRRQEQGEGSSAGLSTSERMLCRWVRTTTHTSHLHGMHGAGQAGYTVSAMQFNISQKQSLECPKLEEHNLNKHSVL